MKKRMIKRLLVALMPTFIMTIYTLFIFGQAHEPVDQFAFLWEIFFLLVVLPILFAVQGMMSQYFKQNNVLVYGISLFFWIANSVVLAPETRYVYVIFYTISFWVGIFVMYLFHKTYAKTSQYEF